MKAEIKNAAIAVAKFIGALAVCAVLVAVTIELMWSAYEAGIPM